MVLLRGLFGARVSYLPTGLNIVQCLGWGIFEIVTIATAAKTVAPSVPRWVFVLLAGAITTALTMRPLGSIRVLRKYVTVAVVLVLTYLFVQLLRHPLPPLTEGTWSGFWIAVDSTGSSRSGGRGRRGRSHIRSAQVGAILIEACVNARCKVRP